VVRGCEDVFHQPAGVSQAGPKARKTSFSQVDSKSVPGRERENNSLKMNDRGGNVIENKGSVFGSPCRSGNVIENKGSCALKAGMLLERKVVRMW
jgi:hypothetical protein